MGVAAFQTPEKQILPIAPSTPDIALLTKWAQDLTRTLAQNLSTIARKANDDSTFTPVGDLNMGGHSITGALNITYTGALTGGTANFTSLRVASTGSTNTILSWLDAGASGVDLIFIKDSVSPAASDVLYRIVGEGRNSSGTLTPYTLQRSLIEDPTAGAEDSSWDLFTYVAGTLGRRVRVRNGMDLNGAADPGAGNISVNSIVLAGTLTGGTTGTFQNGVFTNSITLGGTDGSSASQVPGLVLRQRPSGASETIGPSDGAGGFRGLIGYGATDYWYLRIGDTTTDDIQFNANGIPLFGGQIAFPATQNPSANANTLDDYKEGTFTPAFASTGSTFSYSLQSAKYTKIGNLVFFDITLILNTSGNTLAASALTITGLPFTSASGAGIFPVRLAGSTTSFVSITARTSGTTLIIETKTAAATTDATGLANGVLNATAGSSLRVMGFYSV